jgi:hypothetical protein
MHQNITAPWAHLIFTRHAGARPPKLETGPV